MPEQEPVKDEIPGPAEPRSIPAGMPADANALPAATEAETDPEAAENQPVIGNVVLDEKAESSLASPARQDAPTEPATRVEVNVEPQKHEDHRTTGEAEEKGVNPPPNVTIAVPNLPPPPEFLDLSELHELPLNRLIAMAGQYGLRLGHERSRHQVIFELMRRLLLLGTRIEAEGILDMNGDNTGLLRWPLYNFQPCPEDIFVGHAIIKPNHLRPAQKIRVSLRPQRDTREKYLGAAQLLAVEGRPLEEWSEKTHFDHLTPCHPRERIVLESPGASSVSARAVDLIAPLGKGQRGLIVAPPRAGKTILLKEIAKAIRAGNPKMELLILLVDERPEEVTDFRRSVDAEIFSSTFDEPPMRHVQVAELLGERAKRLVELKRDVVILIDSITRLSRGYNNLQPGKGRIMSGGVESKALIKPKRFFGSARNVEEGGSLTILATALVETESRMDEVIFEEFKGTGNMELHLDRELIERRIFPAIHIPKSGTRKEELLYHPDEYQKITILRKALLSKPPFEAMEELVDALKNTRTNVELLLTGLR